MHSHAATITKTTKCHRSSISNNNNNKSIATAETEAEAATAIKIITMRNKSSARGNNHLLLVTSLMISASLVAALTLALMPAQLASGEHLGDLLMHSSTDQDQQQQQQQAKQQAANSMQPQSTEILVQPNSQVRIECKLPLNNPNNYHWNFLGSSKAPKLLCFQDKCLDDTAKLGYQLEFDSDTGSYDLFIKNATYEQNDGVYYCAYRDSETRQNVEKEFRLTVLILPQPPSIQSASLTPAREAHDYQLSCVTHGGNPEPNISWFRNDLLLGPNPLLRIEQVKLNGTTTSTLTWKPSVDDHQAQYKCSIWNKAMSSELSNQLSLYVEYAPRISVGPHNPLKVILGKATILPCEVHANPPVKSVRWFRDGQLVSNQFNYTISEVKTSDAATYTCQADNGITPLIIGANNNNNNNNNNAQSVASSFVEAQLQLQVLYGPRVQVRASKISPLNEGDYLTLNCTVESWPPAYEFVWTRSDDPSFKTVSSPSKSYLEFASVSAADMGNYTCTAFNKLEPSIGSELGPIERQSSGSAILLVKHKPGIAQLELGQAGETELGLKTILSCRAKPPGFPEPQYKYWRFQGPMQRAALHRQAHGSSYTIHAAKQDDEGRYGCSAFNEMGSSSEADGELIVNEPPQIIHDANTRREQDTRSPGEHPYSITVRSSGKPEPKVSWFHRSPIDGRKLELSQAEMQSKFRIETTSKPEQHHLRPKFNVISTLYFKSPLEVDDRGLYWVEFSNGLSRSASESVQLHIYHTPIPAPKNQPVLASQPLQSQPIKTRAGFEPGETVNLTCHFSAYPQPAIQWFASAGSTIGNGAEPIGTSSRYRTTLSNIKDDIWESSLSFERAQELDYGEYTCIAMNTNQRTHQEAEAKIIVELTRKSAPEPPGQLEVIDSQQDSITIQWVPGFDGGFSSNQFLVQYAPDDGSKLSLAKRFPSADSPAASAATAANNGLEADSSQQLRHYDCLSMNPCTINQLQHRQAYVFRLRAKNELGLSEFSDELRASTRANINQIPRILDASYDTTKNVLHFRLESSVDSFALASLNARIETRLSINSGQVSSDSSSLPESVAQQEASEGWRLHATVPIRQERAEAYLDMQPEVEALRITLCSRANESLCGPELVVSMKSAVSSFLQGERGLLPLNLIIGSLMLIVALAAFASTTHTCCSSRKTKKMLAEGNISSNNNNNNNNNQPDNKPTMRQMGNGVSGSHGSTASTRSTSIQNGATGSQLHSMDSLNGTGHYNQLGGLGGHLANGQREMHMIGANNNNNNINNINNNNNSDHSSDHSRQAKLDSLLPPNYNHYTIDQQQAQFQQMIQQQAGDKLGFGLPNSALLSVVGQQQQQQQQLDQSSPMNPLNSDLHFAYGQSAAIGLENQLMSEQQQLMMSSGLEQQQQQQQQDQQQQLGLWNGANLDDFNAASHYNEQQMIEGTYGVLSQQAAAYDNSANGQQQQFYLGAYQQQQQQFQQEMAAAQQPVYGTLPRNSAGYAQSIIDDEQQQQQYITAAATNGLMQQQMSGAPPPPPPPPQESDYGTARAGRLIREIIV